MTLTIYDSVGLLSTFGAVDGDEAIVKASKEFVQFFDLSTVQSYSYELAPGQYLTPSNPLSTVATVDSFGAFNNDSFTIEFWSNYQTAGDHPIFKAYVDDNWTFSDISKESNSISIIGQPKGGATSPYPRLNASFSLDSHGEYLICDSAIDSMDLFSSFTSEVWYNKLHSNPEKIFAINNKERDVLTLGTDGIIFQDVKYTFASDIVNANAWTHAAITYDGFDFKAFKDGTEIVTIRDPDLEKDSGSLILTDFNIKSDTHFQVKTTFSNTDKTLFFLGSTVNRLHLRTTNSGANLVLSAGDINGPVLTTATPSDNSAHVISWDIQINPGQVRLWIDDSYKGSASIAGSLPQSRWASEEIYALTDSSVGTIDKSPSMFSPEHRYMTRSNPYEGGTQDSFMFPTAANSSSNFNLRRSTVNEVHFSDSDNGTPIGTLHWLPTLPQLVWAADAGALYGPLAQINPNILADSVSPFGISISPKIPSDLLRSEVGDLSLPLNAEADGRQWKYDPDLDGSPYVSYDGGLGYRERPTHPTRPGYGTDYSRSNGRNWMGTYYGYSHQIRLEYGNYYYKAVIEPSGKGPFNRGRHPTLGSHIAGSSGGSDYARTRLPSWWTGWGTAYSLTTNGNINGSDYAALSDITFHRGGKKIYYFENNIGHSGKNEISGHGGNGPGFSATIGFNLCDARYYRDGVKWKTGSGYDEKAVFGDAMPWHGPNEFSPPMWADANRQDHPWLLYYRRWPGPFGKWGALTPNTWRKSIAAAHHHTKQFVVGGSTSEHNIAQNIDEMKNSDWIKIYPAHFIRRATQDTHQGSVQYFISEPDSKVFVFIDGVYSYAADFPTDYGDDAYQSPDGTWQSTDPTAIANSGPNGYKLILSRLPLYWKTTLPYAGDAGNMEGFRIKVKHALPYEGQNDLKGNYRSPGRTNAAAHPVIPSTGDSDGRWEIKFPLEIDQNYREGDMYYAKGSRYIDLWSDNWKIDPANLLNLIPASDRVSSGGPASLVGAFGLDSSADSWQGNLLSNLRYGPLTFTEPKESKLFIGASVKNIIRSSTTGLDYANTFVARTGGNVVTYSGGVGTDIMTAVRALNNGDALVLPAGSYFWNSDGYSGDTIWWDHVNNVTKEVAVVGETNNPNDVVVNPLGRSEGFFDGKTGDCALAFIHFKTKYDWGGNKYGIVAHYNESETAAGGVNAHMFRCVIDWDRDIGSFSDHGINKKVNGKYLIEENLFYNYSSWYTGEYLWTSYDWNRTITAKNNTFQKNTGSFFSTNIYAPNRAGFARGDETNLGETFGISNPLNDQYQSGYTPGKNLRYIKDFMFHDSIKYDSNFIIDSAPTTDSNTILNISQENSGGNVISYRADGNLRVGTDDILVNTTLASAYDWQHTSLNYDGVKLVSYIDGNIVDSSGTIINLNINNLSLATFDVGKDLQYDIITEAYTDVDTNIFLKEFIVTKGVKRSNSFDLPIVDQVQSSNDYLFTASDFSAPYGIDYSPYTGDVKSWRRIEKSNPAVDSYELADVTATGGTMTTVNLVFDSDYRPLPYFDFKYESDGTLTNTLKSPLIIESDGSYGGTLNNVQHTQLITTDSDLRFSRPSFIVRLKDSDDLGDSINWSYDINHFPNPTLRIGHDSDNTLFYLKAYDISESNMDKQANITFTGKHVDSANDYPHVESLTRAQDSFSIDMKISVIYDGLTGLSISWLDDNQLIKWITVDSVPSDLDSNSLIYDPLPDNRGGII